MKTCWRMNQNVSTELCSALRWLTTCAAINPFLLFARQERGITEAPPGFRWLAILAKENFAVSCVSVSMTTSGGSIQMLVQVSDSRWNGSSFDLSPDVFLWRPPSTFAALPPAPCWHDNRVWSVQAAEASTDGPFRLIPPGEVLLNGFVSHTSTTVLI